MDIYEEQLPLLWDSDFMMDSNLIQCLAIGRVHGFDFLVHLTDDYSRWRVEQLIKYKAGNGRDRVVDWCNPKVHRHFKKLKGMKVAVWDLEEDENPNFMTENESKDDQNQSAETPKSPKTVRPSTRNMVEYQDVAKTYVILKILENARKCLKMLRFFKMLENAEILQNALKC